MTRQHCCNRQNHKRNKKTPFNCLSAINLHNHLWASGWEADASLVVFFISESSFSLISSKDCTYTANNTSYTSTWKKINMPKAKRLLNNTSQTPLASKSSQWRHLSHSQAACTAEARSALLWSSTRTNPHPGSGLDHRSWRYIKAAGISQSYIHPLWHLKMSNSFARKEDCHALGGQWGFVTKRKAITL